MAQMAQLAPAERFRSYNRWLQEKFGERVYKVIVDAGFTCPNRDGTVAIGGCTYCKNNTFRPQGVNPLKPKPQQGRTGIAYLKSPYRARKVVFYFLPFINTYGPPHNPNSHQPNP